MADLQGSYLHPKITIITDDLLALFLSGDMYGFTAQLIYAISKAGPADLAKLRHVYPREVIAWELTKVTVEPPTAGELAEMLEAELQVPPGGRNCAVFDGGMFIRENSEPSPQPQQVPLPFCPHCGEPNCGCEQYAKELQASDERRRRSEDLAP
jgi:hypothetical protein